MNWQRPAVEPLRAIGEVCEITGLSARTVRYYEELELLPGVRRRAGGRRVYGADEIERLRFIQRLKALGLALTEIKELNAVYAIGGSTRALLALVRCCFSVSSSFAICRSPLIVNMPFSIST